MVTILQRKLRIFRIRIRISQTIRIVNNIRFIRVIYIGSATALHFIMAVLHVNSVVGAFKVRIGMANSKAPMVSHNHVTINESDMPDMRLTENAQNFKNTPIHTVSLPIM
jgi:hypothetical protein